MSFHRDDGHETSWKTVELWAVTTGILTAGFVPGGAARGFGSRMLVDNLARRGYPDGRQVLAWSVEFAAPGLSTGPGWNRINKWFELPGDGVGEILPNLF